MRVIESIAEIILDSNNVEDSKAIETIQKSLMGEEIHKLTESLRKYREEAERDNKGQIFFTDPSTDFIHRNINRNQRYGWTKLERKQGE